MPEKKIYPCHPPCPIACTAQFIGDKWIMLIIRDLFDGPKRFGDLQQSVISFDKGVAINSKTLTDRLKMLEESGFVRRHAFDHEKPPRVEYTLTEQGQRLSDIFDKIREFGEKYLLHKAT